LTHEAIAERVGRARSTVANTLRLLDLAPVVQAAIADGSISEGHGRALGGLSPEHQEHVLGAVIEQELSVRQTEELVRRLREPKPPTDGDEREQAHTADPDLEQIEEDLRRSLGTKVSLARSRRGGRIVIEYYSDEELGRLYDRLTGGTA
jgi:ParB family chromosome partitioning protein